MFFEKKDKVYQTMRRVVKQLEKAGIAYAIMGAMAVNAHKHRRTTDDLDLLLTEEGLEEFRRRFVGKKYDQSPKRSRRFIDRKNEVPIDVLVAGRFPGSGQPGPLAFPDPDRVSERIEGMNIVNLDTLIDLKLAARRHKDFGDVVDLIRANELDESFADRLHPSVRGAYTECLEEKRREDEYDIG